MLYVKTEAGRNEVLHRTLPLTPAQRLDAPAPTSGNQSYYDDLALKAARTVCVGSSSR